MVKYALIFLDTHNCQHATCQAHGWTSGTIFDSKEDAEHWQRKNQKTWPCSIFIVAEIDDA